MSIFEGGNVKMDTMMALVKEKTGKGTLDAGGSGSRCW